MVAFLFASKTEYYIYEELRRLSLIHLIRKDMIT